MTGTDDDPWLVVVDAQRVFADPAASPWGSQMFPDTVAPIQRLCDRFGDRVVFTRFVAPGAPRGSWRSYYEAFPFARVPDGDPLYALVHELAPFARHTVAAPRFAKWPELAGVVGALPHLVLTGVSTDCCVLSTALAAADAGARVEVVGDACAGSDLVNHQQALAVMRLYAPMVTVTNSRDLLDDVPSRRP